MSSSDPLEPLTYISPYDILPHGLTHVASGKVRELYAVDNDPGLLLFVATDRISAYDVNMANGIPDKGALLTQLSQYWFSFFANALPDLNTHIASSSSRSSVTLGRSRTLSPVSLDTSALPDAKPHLADLDSAFPEVTEPADSSFSPYAFPDAKPHLADLDSTFPALKTSFADPAFNSYAYPDAKPSITDSSLSTFLSLPLSLQGRSLMVRKVPVVPIESIVRGYITGSAWVEYRKQGTVHGILMPRGLREGEKLKKAIWTPSTKAANGEHDENISPEEARALVGSDVARKIEEVSLKLYELARDHAYERGIIIADTKFEFGLYPLTEDLVLIDEVLTPDSSRFWPRDTYQPGRSQKSYDKQYLRDWLVSSGLKGVQGVVMPEEVVAETASKYREAYERLTGMKWRRWEWDPVEVKSECNEQEGPGVENKSEWSYA